eukprot:TRINITY_DN10285_c0_g1_i3.p2 TRINITY_DN10285_c0_g1~~TRINITY_DN10285_c0_g1_i3.p2  ORF type:complete len:140 (+),score=23.43 TRINITY_DN10285_c0_g1_i3:154-573(+)
MCIRDRSTQSTWAEYFIDNQVKVNARKMNIYFCPSNKVKFHNSSYTYGVRVGGWGDVSENKFGKGHWSWLRNNDGSYNWSSAILQLKRLYRPSEFFFLGDSVRYGSTDPGGGVYMFNTCLLYTSPSPRDLSTSRMPSSA